jgi:predicted RNA binding protein YcfA (HicA-like mRNA interferase family)
MKQISRKEFCKVLAQHGWTLLRVHTSHQVYGKAGSNVRLSVPVHANRSLKIGLLRHLMKLAGLGEQDL